MSLNIRGHLLSLISKSLNANKLPASIHPDLSVYFSSEIDKNNILLTISKKSLSYLLNVECINIDKINLIDSEINGVNLKHHEGETYFSFNINKKRYIDDVLSSVSEAKVSDSVKNETVIVEYSSPNIAKPFHMGHLRSTITGQFVANILEKSKKVIKVNYLGDWGTQFGLIQAGLENMSIDIDSIDKDPLTIINKAYVIANQDDKLREQAKNIMSSLEENSSRENLNVWKKLRELTVKHLQETYKMLGIEFDEYTWESQYVKGFDPVLKLMKSKQLICEQDNQLVVLRGDKKMPLMKSDGTSLYLSRDIMAALDRYKRYNCSSIKYVIDKSQEDHVEAVKFVVSKLIGHDIVDHIKFGKIIGMSTRKGTSVFLSDILDKATKLMAEQQDKSSNTKDKSYEVTQTLAISTLLVYFLKQRRSKDLTFDWDKALQSKGDSGVKLQYTHSRLCNLEKNCGVKIPVVCNAQLISEPDALQLILILDRFEETLIKCEKSLEPSYLVNYLFKLCNATSVCLKKLPVKGEATEIAEQRLLLFHKSRLVLKKGMKILGMKPLINM